LPGTDPRQTEQVIALWREGERRLSAADPGLRATMERVRDALALELRRRLGGPFVAAELVALYLDQGTDWCFAIAVQVAPETPEAWDMTTVAGAAFARYVRAAGDYAGGQRILPDS
jgi:hypothetical protein